MNNLQRLIFYLVRFIFAYCILLLLYRDHKNKRFLTLIFNNMAEDSKTYVFGQDCGMLSSLIPLMQKQGIDPNVLALIISKTSGSSEFYNTLDHEKLHVLLHISEACNINLDSEEFEYLSGEITERLYPVSKQFICN